jgi:hypothetical protein
MRAHTLIRARRRVGERRRPTARARDWVFREHYHTFKTTRAPDPQIQSAHFNPPRGRIDAKSHENVGR